MRVQTIAKLLLTTSCQVSLLLISTAALCSDAINVDSFRAAEVAIQRFVAEKDEDSLLSCMLILELPEDLTVRELEQVQERTGRIEFRLMNSAGERESLRQEQVQKMFGHYGGKAMYGAKGSITDFKWNVRFDGELILLYVSGEKLLDTARKIAADHPELVRIVADYPNASLQDAQRGHWPAYVALPTSVDCVTLKEHLPELQLVESASGVLASCWSQSDFTRLADVFGQEPVQVSEFKPAPRGQYVLTCSEKELSSLLPKLNPAFAVGVTGAGIQFRATDREFAALDESIRRLTKRVEQ